MGSKRDITTHSGGNAEGFRKLREAEKRIEQGKKGSVGGSADGLSAEALAAKSAQAELPVQKNQPATNLVDAGLETAGESNAGKRDWLQGKSANEALIPQKAAHDVVPVVEKAGTDSALLGNKGEQALPDNRATLPFLWNGEGTYEGTKDYDDAKARLLANGFTQGADGLFLKGSQAVMLTPFSLMSAGNGVRVVSGTKPADGPFEPSGRSVFVEGLGFKGNDWALFEEGYATAQQRYGAALAKPEVAGRNPRTMTALRNFINQGLEEGQKEVRRESLRLRAELVREAKQKLEQLEREGKAPKKVYIMVEGVDAASKTSNGQRGAAVFRSGGYEMNWHSFRAPDANEAIRPGPGQKHWLDRFKAFLPQGKGVFLADRTPLGNYAYNRKLTETERDQMAADFKAWEQEMEKEGVLVLKLIFDPTLKPEEKAKDPEQPDMARPMRTFGLREARAKLLKERLPEQSRNDPDALASAGALGPGRNDLKSFHDGVVANQRFQEFAGLTSPEHNPWHVIPTYSRNEGRTSALHILLDSLDAWGQRHSTGP